MWIWYIPARPLPSTLISVCFSLKNRSTSSIGFLYSFRMLSTAGTDIAITSLVM